MSNKRFKQTTNRSVIDLSEKPKVIFSKRVINQVDYLHDKVTKNTEWSGILFYSTEGDIKDPSNYVCTLEYIYPMHIGSATYTEYDFSEQMLDVYDKFPEAIDWRIGLVHTHHNMATGFSPTDMSELNDNLAQHESYLSVIVNYAWRPNAKIAFKGIKKTSPSLFSYFGSSFLKGEEKEEEVMFVYNPTIEYEENPVDIDDMFANRYVAVEEQIKKTYISERNYARDQATFGFKPKDSNTKVALTKLLSLSTELDKDQTLAAALNTYIGMTDRVRREYLDELFDSYYMYIRENISVTSLYAMNTFLQECKTILSEYKHMFTLQNKKKEYDQLFNVINKIKQEQEDAFEPVYTTRFEG